MNHPPGPNSKRVSALTNHQFTDENGSEYRGSEFGAFGDYFRNKKIKLQNLDATIREKTNSDGILRHSIFKGCVIHVNGYTRPSIAELHKLVVEYGGVFLQYMDSKSIVTHIVASSLTPRKMVEFARYRVVKPEWITKSIEAGKLLPWHDFRVINPSDIQTQLSVSISKNESEQVTPSKSPVPSPQKHSTLSTYITAEQHNTKLLSDAKVRNSTVLNPNFLKTYYENSRLHHLSTWKADLRLKYQNQITLKLNKPSRSYNTTQKVIFHVDFDCFFASIAIRSRPDLVDKPVCVGHGGSHNSEIASCNYIARKFGVKNGMWMSQAREKCAGLISLPYEFEAYEQASAHLYEVLLEVGADKIEAVSIDEAILDMTSSCRCETESETRDKAMNIAAQIRNNVYSLTKCHVSVGAGMNILLAKIATKQAKPAGHFFLSCSDAQNVISNLRLVQLPGIGYSIREQLEKSYKILLVGQLLPITKIELQTVLGNKIGEKLHNYARGIDHQQVGEISIRKSVSAEVNWGVRFENFDQVYNFLGSLSEELSRRLKNLSLLGSHLTLKVYQRAPDAPLDPPKYLGCGKCEVSSKSYAFAKAINEPKDIGNISVVLMKKLQTSAGEIRGLGLQMTKLSTAMHTLEAIQSKLNLVSGDSLKPRSVLAETAASDTQQPTTGKCRALPEVPVQAVYKLPLESSLDPEIMAQLPEKIRKEIETEYGKIDIIKPQIKPTVATTTKIATKVKHKSKGIQRIDKVFQGKSSRVENSGQEIDESVLAELPEDIRKEILNHRESYYRCTATSGQATQKNSPSKQSLVTLQHSIPTFQGRSTIEDLRDLLKSWYASSMEAFLGPHDEDLALMEQFLRKVVLEEKNLFKATELLKLLSFLADSTWKSVESNIQAISVLQEWVAMIKFLHEVVSTAMKERGIFGSLDVDF
ncbi:hypothetical protein V1514DRAFT_233566 [Lipomyces japonicus]|uniref:uncharacterized protein n=1 Tax=Lipomyces japonicus TaxID=56871 RepID=UPI0034CF4395